MEYHLNGQRVESYSEFKKIIYPLNDPEASRLIREAEQTDFDSWILLSGGLATSLDVALVYSPIILFHVDWEDRVVTFLATAQISLGVWDLVHNAAEARKYNAVQRYNHLIERRQEDADAWQLEPSLYACKDGLVLGEKLSF
jgi:hypothetical protein